MARLTAILHPQPDCACVACGYHKPMLDAEREAHAKTKAELESQWIMLAACSSAALGNTPESAATRIGRENPYWSATYGDVCAAVDREMAHRARADRAEADLAQLEITHLATLADLDFVSAKIAKAEADRDRLAAIVAERPAVLMAAQADRDEAEAEVKRLAAAVVDALHRRISLGKLAEIAGVEGHNTPLCCEESESTALAAVLRGLKGRLSAPHCPHSNVLGWIAELEREAGRG